MQVIKYLSNKRKSTTKPPFCPKPLTVTEVIGNRVTATDGNMKRVRDKNQLKKVVQRPEHLQPPNKKSLKKKPSDIHLTTEQLILCKSNDVFPSTSNEGTALETNSSALFTLDSAAAVEMEGLCNM